MQHISPFQICYDGDKLGDSNCLYLFILWSKIVMLYAGAMERTQIEQTIVLTDFSREFGFFEIQSLIK